METIKFLQDVAKLKRIRRTGWLRHDIPLPESVAEHTYQTAMMAWVLAAQFRLNTDKVVKMALVHDMAEASIGDITPHDGITPKAKFLLEDKAVRQLTAKLNKSLGKEMYELWLEYEKGITAESKFLKQVDKLEMAMQALDYEQRHDRDLTEFWDHTDKAIESRQLADFVKKLRSLR